MEHFFANAQPLPNRVYIKRIADDHLKQLTEWKETIRAGNIPQGAPWQQTGASAPQR
jgi:hypothetical protein